MVNTFQNSGGSRHGLKPLSAALTAAMETTVLDPGLPTPPLAPIPPPPEAPITVSLWGPRQRPPAHLLHLDQQRGEGVHLTSAQNSSLLRTYNFVSSLTTIKPPVVGFIVRPPPPPPRQIHAPRSLFATLLGMRIFADVTKVRVWR